MNSVVIYGASGHGKVVADAALEAGLSVAGFVDDSPDKLGTTLLDLRVLGGIEWLAGRPSMGIAWGIGDNAVRERLHRRVVELGHQPRVVLHPRASISRYARIGVGAVVLANAVVNPDAVIGEGAIVNTAAVVEHDCVLGPFAHLSPNAALGGAVRVGARAHLGVGAAVLPLVSIGDDTIVGAGAVVARPLGAGVVARGVPARVSRTR